jgi:hypothetical protein
MTSLGSSVARFNGSPNLPEVRIAVITIAITIRGFA